MRTKVFDDRMKLQGAFSRLQRRNGWVDGEVITPLGIVTVYHEPGFARFDFVNGGKLHMRNIRGKDFTDRGLTIIASRFAKEIVGAKQ